MVAIALDSVLLIVAAVGWTLAGVSIALNVFFGLRLKRTEEKLDSLPRVKATEGEVIDMGGGNTAKVVMLPNGRLGLNYTLVAEPAVMKIEASATALKVSEERENENE